MIFDAVPCYTYSKDPKCPFRSPKLAVTGSLSGSKIFRSFLSFSSSPAISFYQMFSRDNRLLYFRGNSPQSLDQGDFK